MDHGVGLIRGKLDLSRAAVRHAYSDVVGAARQGVDLRDAWTSVAGGILGYAIGALLYDTLGHWLIMMYGYGDKIETFREAYAQYGSLIILLKGVTPIPYKIVTITSGFAGYNFLLFVLFSFFARGIRFYFTAFLLNRYGLRARVIIEERLGFWFTISLGVLVAGIIAAVYLF